MSEKNDTPRQVKKPMIVINSAMLVIYLLVANPLITGLAVHEWLSVACLLVVMFHVALHFDWHIATLLGRSSKDAIWHLVLDLASLITFTVAMVSGFMVSRYILPAIDMVALGYYYWNPIHSISAKLLLVLLIVHVFVHAAWFAAVLFKKSKKSANVDIAKR